VRVDPKARASQGAIARAGLAPPGRLDGATYPGAQPLHGRLDGVLRVRRHAAPFADLDEWLRRRLRQVRWKEWKRYRTRRRNLRALGIPERAGREWAGSRKGYGRIAGPAPLQRALPNVYWSDLG
jgi:hypothetical protein